MTYRIQLARSAAKDLDDLPHSLREAVIAEIRKLGSSPRPRGSKKLAGTGFNWRIRVRKYRVLYTIHDKERTVRIYRIKHRSQAYR